MKEEMNGAQALAGALVRMETERVYGIIGTSNVAFVDALYEQRHWLEYVSCRHEQVAASMADAEGRLTGRPGVVLVHSGPGALNAMISAGNAYKDCSPMMIITGAVKRRLSGCDGMLEVDHRRLFGPLCKGAFRVEAVAEMPRVFSQAYRAAMSGARGPVLIEVPEDVWTERAEVDLVAMELASDPPAPVNERDVRDTLDMIASARLSLVLSGGGVACSHSSGKLVQFVEALSLPVITTGNGRGTIPETHPLCLGRVGFGGGNLVADRALEKCDALLCLGAGISDMTTYEFTAPIGAGQIRVVNVSPGCLPSQAPRARLIVCDVAGFLGRLVEMAGDGPRPVRPVWDEVLAEARTTWNSLLQALLQRETELPSASRVASELARRLPADTIVAVGAGVHLLYAMAFMPCQRPLTYLSTVNFGAMGFGLAAAMAAAKVHPGRSVLAVLGDGDFMMTLQDLETAVRQQLDIKVVILNDFQYRVLKLRQRLQFGARVLGTEHGNPDFADLARSFGASGYRLDRPESIGPVLDAALSQRGPVLIDAIIDAEDLPPTNVQATLRMSA
ncbi:MAG: thiamine pyrophosphate-binding protein [Chloroflexi bacterium]|nr:thiamine pyrophosphate-binding protein [Chloroflexota bacterium]